MAMKNDNLMSRIRDALSTIIDPETRLDVARMELIHDIGIQGDGEVSLIFRPSSPICPMAYSLANSIKKTLLNVDGVTSVRIRVENFNRGDHLEGLINETTD